ncbi:hypothetical protein [Magnetospirillum sulfuroxidans]|nr:hypothetical protein [Magnetospirillum sulfuroxidans]
MHHRTPGPNSERGDAKASQKQLQQAALRKVEYALAKKAEK